MALEPAVPPPGGWASTAALQVPGHFHPPLQVQAAAELLALETGGVHLVAAEGLGEMCGVLSGQAAGGGQAGGALGMAHHLTL